MTVGKLRAQWLSYRNSVLPPDASAVQLQECRRAFYAGAQALRAEFYKTSDNPRTEAAELMALEGELDSFARAVKEGLA